MSESEKLSIAAHLYVTLRRKFDRVIDVEWMLQNGDYAREVIKIVRKSGMEESAYYANRMDELIFGMPIQPSPVPTVQTLARTAPPPLEEREEDEANASQYVGTLR
jgi:hypothetical protein